MEPTNSPDAKLLATPIPPIRLANSPTVKRRKNLVGSCIRRPHMAASAEISIRVDIRITAIDRTIPKAAVVKLVTIRAWVTVASPCLSKIGIISWNMVSVIIGVANGIQPPNKLQIIMVR